MLRGIDLSQYQGQPNFDSLKLGVDFIILKASEGTGYKDPQFDRNKSECRRVGIPVGFYTFARPDLGNTPQTEAAWFLNCVGELKEGDILFLDIEVVYTDLVNWSKQFLDAVSAKLNGYKPLIYLNKSQIQSNSWKPVVDGNYGLWCAYYDNDPTGLPFDTPWPAVAFKQYSSSGTIDGINGKVDMDSFFGDLVALKKYGVQIVPVPTPIPPTPLPPTPIPTPPGSQPMRQIIIDCYRALCGVNPTEDEIKTRLDTGINTYALIMDICHGDERFFKTWIAPYVPQLKLQFSFFGMDFYTIEKPKS